MNSDPFLQVAGFREFAGQGVEAGCLILQSGLAHPLYSFLKMIRSTIPVDTGTHIYVSLNGD